MVSKNELRSYQDMSVERWASRNFVLGSIIAGALLIMAVAGSTMGLQPHADPAGHSGISELSASQKRSNTAFYLMSTASEKLPIESWGEHAV
jgi:hypothetical protein